MSAPAITNLGAALRAVTAGETLSRAAAEATMGDIMDGGASQLQVAALMGALRMRDLTTDEMVGFIEALRARALQVHSRRFPLVDTCGTGGDSSKHGISTFNISTAATFIAAGAGVAIAKHGNRAMSSKSGSADVLEALGVNINLSPEQIGYCIDEIGIGFMFAQAHHPAMKHVAPIRRELGIRTFFNMIAPIVNPAEATVRMMGVPDARWLRPIAEVLQALGCHHAIVAHSDDGLDEFSTCAPTRYIEVCKDQLEEKTFDPNSLGLICTKPQSLQGGDAGQNATIIQQLLHDGEGPTADIACLNAAAVLIVADMASNFEEGLKLARAAVNGGEAREKLHQLIEFSNRASSEVAA